MKNTFISAGVYTTETIIPYISSQNGAASVAGICGEFPKGPAFQPIFEQNYTQHTAIFGGLDASKFPGTGWQKFEAGYIAKSYLAQSNNLWIVRILGLSGYNAGRAWGITLNGALNTSTVTTTDTGNSISNLFTVTYTSARTITSVISSTEPSINTLWNYSDSNLVCSLSVLPGAIGTTGNCTATYYKPVETASGFTGISFSYYVTSTGTTSTSGIYTANTSGITAHYAGHSYSNVENKLVILLRSRATYDGQENLVFQLSADTVGFSTASNATGATLNALNSFTLTGSSVTYPSFSYNMSLDNTANNYIFNVLGQNNFDKKTALFVEEDYTYMFDEYVSEGQVRGVHMSLINYGTYFSNYKQQYQPAYTPWVVSQIMGNKILKLFRFETISDGDTANSEVKVSIANIDLDNATFDVIIRSYEDSDSNPNILEKWSNCNMLPTDSSFIGQVIGTNDGNFPQKSNYVLVELNTDDDSSMGFPSGFVGYPMRDFTVNGNTTVQAPSVTYKTSYASYENKRKAYLGESDIVGIDQNLYNYNGLQNIVGNVPWTGLTHGFHMDVNATGTTTIDGYTVTFDCGNAAFQTSTQIIGTDYEQVYARKFTLVPAGGFNGWDIFRTQRTNTDDYQINGRLGLLGVTKSNFSNTITSDGDNAITSDYYAYKDGYLLFGNKEQTPINLLSVPGIDTINNTELVNDVISVIEDNNIDTACVVATPDTDADGLLTEQDVVDAIYDNFDSSYIATYWPWKQYNDTENNQYIWIPCSADYMANAAYTDNKFASWYATAGLARGKVDCVQLRKILTQAQRDTLYGGRINPVAFFPSEGNVIWGNKNLQINNDMLNRLSIRRLLNYAKQTCRNATLKFVFDQDDATERGSFTTTVNPILKDMQTKRGLTDFRVIVSNAPEDIDNHELNATIWLKPTPSLEYISINFVGTPQSVSFDDAVIGGNPPA